MRISWAGAARHYVQVAAFCCVIAVLTTLIWPGKSYLSQLGYALSVGTATWTVIEFGRYFVPARYCLGAPARTGKDGEGEPTGHGWPQGWRGVLLTALGIGCGFLVGAFVADWFFDRAVAPSTRDNALSLAITVVAGAVGSFYFHARGKAATLAAKIVMAERDASEARLKLLESQLEPHMLFNTLANLRALIAVDPPRAVAMLDRLNSYLRATLSGSRAVTHPLASEFDRLADYLELMSVRMGDRLRYVLDLPADLRGVPVPPLLLQPLVENGIRHGLEPQVDGGEITVRARREGTQLVIDVIDTGIGIGIGLVRSEGHAHAAHEMQGATASDEVDEGFGTAQVRERLAALHGSRASLTLARWPAGGTCATLAFPLPSSPSSPSSP